MNQLKTLDDTLNIINTGEPVLIYFSGKNCSVCDVLKPKIESEVTKHFKKMKIFEVKTELYKEIASHFTVFSIPTTLAFLDTKEFYRVGRNMSIFNFIQHIRRPYELYCNEDE